MKLKFKHLLFLTALAGLFGFTSSPFTWVFSGYANNTVPVNTKNWIQNEMHVLKAKAGNIDNTVLRLALTAYSKVHKRGYSNKPVLTVIDYSKPSNKRRLWVFDLKRNKVLFNTWVAHGKNSGDVRSTSFSNSPGSLKSSVGVFVTQDTYDGKNGYSLRLRGLDRGLNDNAYSRAIVVHGAAYTTPSHVGRSWGCPAVGKSVARPIINSIKDKSVLFAYYPGRWISHSAYL